MMHEGDAATLWFVAPGLAHALGNALFTVKGRARLLTLAPQLDAEDCQAIQDGVDRAQETLTVLRWLLHEGSDESIGVRSLFAGVEHALRVPLRDRGLGVVVAIDAAGEVDAGTVCRLVVGTCRALVDPVPSTVRGDLCMQVDSTPSELRIRLGLQVEPGAAPFARDLHAAADQLRDLLAAASGRSEPLLDGTGLLLTVPLHPSVPTAG